MDREDAQDLDFADTVGIGIDVDEVDLDVESGGGDGADEPPDQGTGGGRGGRTPGGAGDGFLHKRWAVVVPPAVVLLFGLQSLLVVTVSRSGLGSETVAWAIAGLFILTFTGVFILGARFIARHRD